jgi:hypothetical protein
MRKHDGILMNRYSPGSVFGRLSFSFFYDLLSVLCELCGELLLFFSVTEQ